MKQKHFDVMICDFDRALYVAAKSVEKSTVIITNKKTGESEEFENVSTFWGRGKEPKGLLGTFLRLLGVKSPKSDWIIEEKVVLSEEITDHLEEAKRQVAFAVGAIKRSGLADDYLLCIGGDENFRYDVATIKPYKGERPDKPLIYQELKEAVIDQYKIRVNIAEGWEADDTLGMYAAENQEYYKKYGKWKYVLNYIDKDLKQLVGPYVVTGREDEGLKLITPKEAAINFATQLLTGDDTDNIPGLPDISTELREKYNLPKRKGCGEKAAEAVIRSCSTTKEIYERIVELYKDYYKDDWKDTLNENFRLLWMLRKKDINANVFDDLLDKMKVDY